MLKKESFLGFNFNLSNSIEHTANEIMSYESAKSFNSIPIVLTLNVDYVVQLNRPENKELLDRLQKSAFIFADGQPIVWASRFYKKNIKHRITGSDLFPQMYSIAKSKSINILLISPGKDTSDFYRKDFPAAHIYDLPFIEKSNTQAFDRVINECAELITKHDIKVVFIGVSFPKQDLIALGIFDALKSRKCANIPILGLLGASLEFTAGVKKRAPVIYQKLGMEWFYRFIREPRRLFRRYFIESFEFLSVLNSFENKRQKKVIINTEPVKHPQTAKNYMVLHNNQPVPPKREQHISSSLTMKIPTEVHNRM